MVVYALVLIYSGYQQGGFGVDSSLEAQQRDRAGTLLVCLQDGHSRLRLGGGSHPWGSIDGAVSYRFRHMGRLDRRVDPCSADHALGCPHHLDSVYIHCEAYTAP